ncbi:MAG: DUF4258 domain-containing protein [bacterium]
MLITEVTIKNRKFNVETTTHALQRMEQRMVDKYVVAGIILCLGERLLAYNDSGEEIAIVDQHNNLTIIIQVRSYKAVVITVINKTGIYIREGTKLEQIA